MDFPSGLNSPLTMQPGCGMGSPSGVSVAASHNRSSPLLSPVAKVLQSGLSSPCRVWRPGLACGLGLCPWPHRRSTTSDPYRRTRRSCRRDRDSGIASVASSVAGWATERRPEGSTGRCVPDPGRLAAFHRQEDLAVQAETSVMTPTRLWKARADGPAGGRVPELGIPRVIPHWDAEQDAAFGARANVRAGDP